MLDTLNDFKNPRILIFFLAIFVISFSIVYGIYSTIADHIHIRDYKANPYAPVVLMVKMEGGYNIIVVKSIAKDQATCFQMKRLIDSKADARIYLMHITKGLKSPLTEQPLDMRADVFKTMDIVELTSPS